MKKVKSIIKISDRKSKQFQSKKMAFKAGCFSFAGFLLSIILMSRFAHAMNSMWTPHHSIRGNQTVYSLYYSPSQETWIGSDEGILVMERSSRVKKLLNTRFGAIQTYNISVSHDDRDRVFAATDQGLLISMDNGETWEILFEAASDSETCLSVLEKNERIYLGTMEGLYIGTARSAQWRFIDGQLKEHPVYEIASIGEAIYLFTDQSVYRLEEKDISIDKMIDFGQSLSEDDDGHFKSILAVDQALNGSDPVIFVTKKGFYAIDADGRLSRLDKNFYDTEKVSDLEILNIDDIEGRCQRDPFKCFQFVVSTHDGVFIEEDDGWQPLYQGLDGSEIYDIEQCGPSLLCAGTRSGIYELVINLPSRGPRDYLKSNVALDFSEEPDIRRVHQWAIHYADVHPSKIDEWRQSAKKRALWPSVSLGVDGGQDWGRSNSLWGASSGSLLIGPDDKTYGSDLGWDVSLTWDLADWVWSTDQTTIDSRSKLMVELREDILDQVTRLYFERRRLQMELARLNTVDQWDQETKQLRIEELTALIDGLTGGKFSQDVKGEDHE